MAEITKAGGSSGPASVLLPANDKVSELRAGEAIATYDACYVKASDGRVWRCSGAAATAPARCRGFAAKAASAGEAVTLISNVIVGYGTSLTPGDDLFLSSTVAGGLANVATTGGTLPVAFVVDAQRVKFLAAN